MFVLPVWAACVVTSTFCPVMVLAAGDAALGHQASTLSVAKQMALRALSGTVDVRQNLLTVYPTYAWPGTMVAWEIIQTTSEVSNH